MTDALVHALRNSELDVALMALPAPSDALECAPLFEEAFLAVFPSTRTGTQTETVLSQLGRPDLLLLEDGHCLRDQALSICPTVPRQGEQRLASSLEMLWYMIGAGEGFSSSRRSHCAIVRISKI